MNRIAVLTSGGDSPGMNAAIRAVTRTAIYLGMEVYGVYRGFDGLVSGDFSRLHSHDVSNIIQRGGTILKSARSKAFRTAEGMQMAYDKLREAGIDGLIVIGGDGTFSGAAEFGERFSFPVNGLPGTIDNDLFGTDATIGFDTALNTVVDAVDKIRDTADSHNRLFFIEVMGRDAGFIALHSGIATGAEDILIPERHTSVDELIAKLRSDIRTEKRSAIIIVAEGDDAGGAYDVARQVTLALPAFSHRVTILGHVQRGGSPTCADRVLASRLGHAAVNAFAEGQFGRMFGLRNDKVVSIPFREAVKSHNEINHNLLELARVLAL